MLGCFQPFTIQYTEDFHEQKTDRSRHSAPSDKRSIGAREVDSPRSSFYPSPLVVAKATCNDARRPLGVARRRSECASRSIPHRGRPSPRARPPFRDLRRSRQMGKFQRSTRPRRCAARNRKLDGIRTDRISRPICRRRIDSTRGAKTRTHRPCPRSQSRRRAHQQGDDRNSTQICRQTVSSPLHKDRKSEAKCTTTA